MDRKDAFKIIEALLEREGRKEVLAVARDAFAGDGGAGEPGESSRSGSAGSALPSLVERLEAQLVVNDRFASLGRLAASVGHELNNPLAYVLGNVALMERELARAEYVRPELRENLSSCIAMIQEGAERIRDIVHDLRTISRSDEHEHASLDVQQILDVCVNLAEHELRSRARVVRDYRAKVYVRGSSARLGQVLLNVLNHVTQAIAPGRAEQNEVRVVVDTTDADGALIEVRHTGEALPAGALERLSEPLSASHPPRWPEPWSEAAGLSIARGLVVAAGGTITAAPLPDRGAVFRIVLPSS